MVRHIVRAVLLLLLSSPAFAGDFNIYLGDAKSETNRHGQSRFRTISFELTGRPQLLRYIERYLPGARAGVDIDYADVRRSEERRVGKECSLTCRSRWSPYH